MKSVPKQSKINPFSTACHSDENSRCCVTFSICTNTAKNNNSIAVFTTTKCTNNNQPNSSKEPVHEREGRCSQLTPKPDVPMLISSQLRVRKTNGQVQSRSIASLLSNHIHSSEKRQVKRLRKTVTKRRSNPDPIENKNRLNNSNFTQQYLIKH